MEPLPHIDIGGDRRIEAILQDPANAVVEAVTCETLGGWVPDIGLTTYSHRSIYRPPVLARSGLATTLAHRFWRTIQGLMDHTGTRWIGVLIYDQQGEPCPMELQVAGRAVGRLEPIRHDNRRHLIVADRPVEFFGGMEVFQLTAPGPGTYRIEALVFLAARPEPSSFAPTIRHLTARSRPEGAELHFTTDHVARAELVVRSGDTVAGRSRTDRRTKLHAVAVEDLADGDYRCEVTATGIAGETDRASRDVAVRGDAASALPAGAGQAVTVPVEIVDVSGAGQTAAGMPVTFGVPLPRGRLPRALTGRLQAGGVWSPAQCRVHSPWPDGSARWVLVDAVVPAPLPPGGRIAGTVHVTPEAVPGTSVRAGGSALLAEDGLRIELDPERPTFPTVLAEREVGAHVLPASTPPSSTVEIRLANGAALIPRSSAAVQEESGAERSVLRYHVDHCDRDGTPHLRSIVRIHVYRAQRHLRIQHRLEVVSPALGPAAGDPRETPVPVESGAASRGITETGRGDATATAADVAACVGCGPGEENTLLEISSAVARVAIPGTRALVADGRRHELSANGHWRLVQADDRGYLVYKVPDSDGPIQAAEGRFPGRLLLETEYGLIGLAVRRFWQTCPTGLWVDGDGAAVELLPELTPEPTAGQPGADERPKTVASGSSLGPSPPGAPASVGSGADTPDPTDAESWHQLFFWRTSRGYLLKAGQALTGEIAVSLPGTPEEAERIAAWCEQPALVRPAIDWLNGTGVLSPIRAKSASPHPRYERTVDRACDEWLRERDTLRQYGFLNFGDWYGESGWSWGNNEYDPAFAHYQEFLRGGRAEWAVLAAEAARHLVDVDTCNHSSDPAQVGGQYGHMPGHAGGYLPAYFRSKVAGSCMFYSHSWVEGPVLHYLLTGDESVRETLERIGEWLLAGRTHGVIGGSVVADRQGLDAYDYGQLRDAGWHLIHLCALARWSDDPRFMNAAHLVAERLLERRTPGGGWERLLGEGHCFAGPPRTRGEASFMVGVCLSALRRYHELTGDERVATAILDGARWLVEHTYDRQERHFRYTSSPSRGESGPAHTQQVIEGLVYALSLRPDAEIEGIVRHGLHTLGAERRAAEPLALGAPGASSARGVGPSLCHETRYVPTMLAYLPEGFAAGPA